MQRSYVFGTVQETRRTGIYVIRVKDDPIDSVEAEEIAERMRKKMLSHGEVATEVAHLPARIDLGQHDRVHLPTIREFTPNSIANTKSH